MLKAALAAVLLCSIGASAAAEIGVSSLTPSEPIEAASLDQMFEPASRSGAIILAQSFNSDTPNNCAVRCPSGQVITGILRGGGCWTEVKCAQDPGAGRASRLPSPGNQIMSRDLDAIAQSGVCQGANMTRYPEIQPGVQCPDGDAACLRLVDQTNERIRRYNAFANECRTGGAAVRRQQEAISAEDRDAIAGGWENAAERQRAMDELERAAREREAAQRQAAQPQQQFQPPFQSLTQCENPYGGPPIASGQFVCTSFGDWRGCSCAGGTCVLDLGPGSSGMGCDPSRSLGAVHD